MSSIVPASFAPQVFLISGWIRDKMNLILKKQHMTTQRMSEIAWFSIYHGTWCWKLWCKYKRVRPFYVVKLSRIWVKVALPAEHFAAASTVQQLTEGRKRRKFLNLKNQLFLETKITKSNVNLDSFSTEDLQLSSYEIPDKELPQGPINWLNLVRDLVGKRRQAKKMPWTVINTLVAIHISSSQHSDSEATVCQWVRSRLWLVAVA